MDVRRRNNVTVTGRPDGPTMVFAHGFGCDQGVWSEVAPHFEASHRVVLFDHVGAGQSDLVSYDPARYGALDAYASDLVDVVESVVTGPEPVVFVGHSVSGTIGILAAAARPELFSSLVLVGPSPRYIDEEGYTGGFSRAEIDELLDTMDDNYLGWAAQLAPVVMGSPDRPELGSRLTSSFCRTDPTIARQFARTTFLADNRPDFAAVRARTIVLQSRDDVIAPLPVGEYVHHCIEGSRLVVLDAVGHCPHLSAPDQVVAAMTDFLAVP